MKSASIHLGYQVGSGEPVDIPVRHMAVTGQTQESGKTTALTALISRAKLPAIAFLTKRGEGDMPGRKILPYFQERADWRFVQSILESTMREKMKFERAWIVRATKGANTLLDVQLKLMELENTARNALSKDVYMLLGEYLERVVPLLDTLPKTDKVDVGEGLAVMDLVRYPLELQMLVISSTLSWIHQHAEGVISILPEAWKFIPQGRNTPVRIAAENLMREGAGIKNYVWIDSQDMAGVDKILLRGCPVWLIGVQREALELKRALANMPEGLKKPKAGELATLEVGQFFACFGKSILKTYVEPVWMQPHFAMMIAKGDLVPSEQKLAEWKGAAKTAKREEENVRMADTAKLKNKFVDDPFNALEVARHSLESGDTATALETINAALATKHSGTEPTNSVARTAAASGASSAAVQTSAAKMPAFKIPDGQFDVEGLYQVIKARLMMEAPAMVKILSVRPEIQLQVQRRTITMDDSTIKGKVAVLLHEGWLDQEKSGADVYKELLRRGMNSKTPSIRVYEALKDFSSMGFLYVTADKKYHSVQDAKVNIVGAA